MIKKASLIFVFLLCLTIFFGCNAPSLFLIGLVEINLDGKNAGAAKKEMLKYIEAFEKTVAVDIESSDIYKINNSKQGEKITVSDITKTLLSQSFSFYKKTSGAFNIASFPATVLWGFSAFTDQTSHNRIPPSSEEIQAVLPLLGIENIILDGNIAWKNNSNAKIDFGGIAKGYLADECYKIATKHGIESGIINISSNLYMIGKHKENRPYKIGVTPPRGEANYLMSVEIENNSISQTGDYERYFLHDEKRYSHIIDSKTGSPTDTEIMSVTVINPSSMLCDVYSTAGFVMGVKGATEFFSIEGINSIIAFIRDEKKYFVTTGELTYSNVNGEYTEWIDLAI